MVGTAPVMAPRPPGARARAGNAMERTRQSILDGAASVLATRGVHATTMAEIAAVTGVAKATLYNHFRTRADVYASLAAREIDTLAVILAGAQSGEVGLREAADWIATHPVIRAVAADEPELVGWFLDAERAPSLWSAVRDALGGLLRAESASAPVDVALRWLASFFTAPGISSLREHGAALVAHQGVPAALGT